MFAHVRALAALLAASAAAGREPPSAAECSTDALADIEPVPSSPRHAMLQVRFKSQGPLSGLDDFDRDYIYDADNPLDRAAMEAEKRQSGAAPVPAPISSTTEIGSERSGAGKAEGAAARRGALAEPAGDEHAKGSKAAGSDKAAGNGKPASDGKGGGDGKSDDRAGEGKGAADRKGSADEKADDNDGSGAGGSKKASGDGEDAAGGKGDKADGSKAGSAKEDSKDGDDQGEAAESEKAAAGAGSKGTGSGAAGNSTERDAKRGDDDKVGDAASPKNTSHEGRKHGGCVTRFDPRATAVGYTTSPPGTPCVFGVDDRDEGYHCIPDEKYGSFGWCWTDAKQRSFGSCSEGCPLYGANKVLEQKMESLEAKVEQTLEALAAGPCHAGCNGTSNSSGALPAAEHEPQSEAAAPTTASMTTTKPVARSSPAAAKGRAGSAAGGGEAAEEEQAGKEEEQARKDKEEAKDGKGDETGHGDVPEAYHGRHFACCKEDTASCLACKQGVQLDVYCQSHVHASGCEDVFDCAAGERRWRTGWSEAKKAFCCKKAGVGCEHRVSDDANSRNATGGGNATEGKNKAAKAVNVTCVTRSDPRASSVGYNTAKAGTACVFGVDNRDEGYHCIMDKTYGSFGWCWTNEAKSDFGSCSESCPLSGPSQILERMIESLEASVAKAVDIAANSTPCPNKSSADAAAANATAAMAPGAPPS